MASSSTPWQNQTQPENAFGQLVPYSASASIETWDIFINHHGDDVEHTLATTLYHKLLSMGFCVFLDAEAINLGDSIPAEVRHAITSAALLFAIFSPKYAESVRCLTELSYMVKTGAKIIPIFYHVEPSDLTWIDQRTGMYADAFSEHENNGRFSAEKLDEWKRALKDVSFLPGYLVNNKEDDSRVLKDIASFALEASKTFFLMAAEYLRGLDERLRDFQSVGMRSSSMTTFAREKFNRNFSLFRSTSFDLKDFRNLKSLKFLFLKFLGTSVGGPIVGGFSTSTYRYHNLESSPSRSLMSLKPELCSSLQSSSLRKLVELQLQTVNSLEDFSPLRIPDMANLRKLVELKLRTVNSLKDFSPLRIPDMADLSSLEELRPFTRMYLRLQELHLSEVSVNFIRDLPNLQCIRIHECCRLAELPTSLGPLSALQSLVDLPALLILEDLLALQSLVDLQSLCIRRCLIREESLTSLRVLRLLPESTFRTVRELGMLPTTTIAIFPELKMFSHSLLHAGFYRLITLLKQSLQEMFLDTACFLNGEKKSRAITLWDGSGWNGLHGIETLQNICLVQLVDDPDYDGEKVIRMHDLLRALGRKIASRHSPHRVWFPEQIVNMKKHAMERELIRGITSAKAFRAFKMYMHRSVGKSSRRSKHMRFPTGLRILFVEGNVFTEELASISEDIVWLRWEGFPLENLPSWLPVQNLRVLELYGANELEGLWDDKEHAPLQLRELIITGTWSASFERFPISISNLNHLSKIALLGDVGKEFGIKGLPEEFRDLQSLEHLELRHCTLLSSLPARFGDLRNLRHLDLCSCKGLRRLPDSFKQLTKLQCLDLSGCKKLALQIDILENITELKNLNLSGCHKLRQLPDQIIDQAYLRKLLLEDTRLEDLPANIGQLRKLELLTIGSPFLTSLPVSLGDLSSLKSLSIIDCIDLESLPDNFGRLTLLEYLYIESSELRSLPEGFTELTNLKKLKISGCPLGELDSSSSIVQSQGQK